MIFSSTFHLPANFYNAFVSNRCILFHCVDRLHFLVHELLMEFVSCVNNFKAVPHFIRFGISSFMLKSLILLDLNFVEGETHGPIMSI